MTKSFHIHWQENKKGNCMRKTTNLIFRGRRTEVEFQLRLARLELLWQFVHWPMGVFSWKVTISDYCRLEKK